LNHQEPINNHLYLIPFSANRSEFVVKKSRFIGCIQHVTSRSDAMNFLESMQLEFSDASHHCWAYQLGNPLFAHNAAMSDDGEPSGTAGSPIVNVMKHQPVGDCMVIVVRYYGGIKLGVGGLVRAYSTAAKMTFDNLPTRQHITLKEQKLIIDYADEQFLRHWLKTNNGTVIDMQYSDCIVCKVSIPYDSLNDLTELSASRHWKIVLK